MAGGDAFFEEGIHWLHIANSLGPVITAIQGLPAAAEANGAGRAGEDHAGCPSGTTTAPSGRCTTRGKCPSLLRGVRLSKLFGRDGIITFESNGGFVLVRGRRRAAWPEIVFPGFPRHPRLPGDVPGLCPLDSHGRPSGDESRGGDGGSASDGADLRDRRRCGRPACTDCRRQDQGGRSMLPATPWRVCTVRSVGGAPSGD